MKNTLKVGIFSVVTLGLMFVTVIYIGKCTASRGSIPFRVQFEDLDDLRTGAIVKFAGGLSIGYVKDIYRAGTKAELVLWIEKEFPITRNSSFIIRSAGMLGEKYVQLRYEDGPQAPPNHLFQGTNAASIGSALVMIQQFMDEAKKMIRTVNAILGSGDQTIIRNTATSLAGIVQKINVLLANSNETLTDSVANIKNITAGLTTTVNSVNQILTKINAGQGTLGMLISDKKLQKELTELIQNLKEAAIKLNKSSLLNSTQNQSSRW